MDYHNPYLQIGYDAHLSLEPIRIQKTGSQRSFEKRQLFGHKSVMVLYVTPIFRNETLNKKQKHLGCLGYLGDHTTQLF